jgi:hypothetical protein
MLLAAPSKQIAGENAYHGCFSLEQDIDDVAR